MQVSADVFHGVVGGLVVILHMPSEEYLILDEVGTSMWSLLLAEEDDSAIVRSLSDIYSVEIPQLKEDLINFKMQCVDKGLLVIKTPIYEISEAPRIKHNMTRLSMWRAWWCLLITSRRLSSRGLNQTYRECCQTPALLETPDSDASLMERALNTFSRAENFFVSKEAPQDCLPRSLALFLFLRSSGLAVEHCIGIRRFPFHAHAWVEHNGVVVHDNPLCGAVYKTIARIAV